jgi:hypothetical protein
LHLLKLSWHALQIFCTVTDFHFFTPIFAVEVCVMYLVLDFFLFFGRLTRAHDGAAAGACPGGFEKIVNSVMTV